MSVLIETSFGDIVVDLFTKKAPTACLNFIKLCKIKFYHNALFAQVQKNYVTQVTTQEPSCIWKEVGEDVQYFKDEIDMEGKINERGLLATSNIGSNLNNSNFFITLTKANLTSLNGKHTIFGRVEEGEEVLKKINDTYVDRENKPQMNIRIIRTFILDDPFEDPKSMKIPSKDPPLQISSDRLEAIEHLQMLQKCQSQQEIIEATKIQKAKKQATTLQILGELPDASMKPQQNILFVCKLNPLTQERDLQVIFSRFGPIKSVEIVRDWKTGQSLQYGFIQFENISACEEAYLKMNNVIIDDRRISVDFSQSVQKLMSRNKGQIIRPNRPGEKLEKMRQLVPKAQDLTKRFGNSKYDFVTSSQQPKMNYQNYSDKIEETTKKAEFQKREPNQKQVERHEQKMEEREKEKRRKKQSSEESRERRKQKRKYKRSSSSESPIRRKKDKKIRKRSRS